MSLINVYTNNNNSDLELDTESEYDNDLQIKKQITEYLKIILSFKNIIDSYSYYIDFLNYISIHKEFTKKSLMLEEIVIDKINIIIPGLIRQISNKKYSINEKQLFIKTLFTAINTFHILKN